MEKKKVWFWGVKDDGEGGGGRGSGRAKDAEDDVADHLSRDGTMSQYSLSKGLLPSLGANNRSSRDVILRRFIISPFDPRYRAWETFLVFLVLYTAWASPFEFGFLQKPRPPLSILDNIVNGFFAVDIILTFFVAFLDKVTYLLIDDPKRIAWRYASTWLIFDVVSTFPYEIFGNLLHESIQGYGIFSMLRLWRLRRVSNCFARLEKDRKYSYFWVRCTKLLLVTLFVIHCGACFLYSIAAHYPDPSKTFMALTDENWKQSPIAVRYNTAMYWSITTFSTTGYGDIHGVNSREMTFILFYMVFNLGLSAYIIGNMTNLVVHVTGRTRKFRDTIQAASGFGQRNNLPVRLQDQMVAHLCLRYRTDSEGLQQQEIIDSLPKAIRSSISHYLFYEVVDKIYLFHGISNDLLFQLVTEMKAEYFPPKEDVILQNEAPTDFYILVTGAVDIIARVNGVEQVVSEAQRGNVFGEVGVLCYRPQLFTVRTKRLSQLLRLNRTVLLNLVQANVGDGAIIMNNLLQHLKDSEDPVMKGVLADTEHMLAQGKMDLPLSLCFAAARGDDLLLHQLLRRGSSPNEMDKDGRTALHIAASKGSHYCVVLLLEHGADPNIRDSEGNVPLWEAIIGRHREIAKLLAENGAKLSLDSVSYFSGLAVEKNSLDALKDIIKYGGDVTLPDGNGTTALHRAVSEGHLEIVKFLLDRGADLDRPDSYGWTPRGLADHQGNEDIKTLFHNHRPVEKKPKPVPGIPQSPVTGKPLMKYSSEPTMHSGELVLDGGQVVVSQRKKLNNFRNSLFGFISAANTADDGGEASRSPAVAGGGGSMFYPARVTISSPENRETGGKVVLLPTSMEELLKIGEAKMGFVPTKVLTREGAEIDDITLIRDGDFLLLSRDP
ncbi:Ankyrin repeat [Arabidopsis thaliana x Arabidopsis arenosa]|uniref:Potassium channel n=1 Tax=Arabidopsis thaliana x Arabidopsis arenosa TaxID=1240361 RepID=A0A8T2A3J9_9BRAS|nr:Ankyrin repeat [Arabidopsis thaliana x Arabidopsis arenosa]